MRHYIYALLALFSAAVFANEKEVLVVHSYHQGFFWTDDFQRGLVEQFDEHDVSYRTLYLDAKRNQSPEFLRQLRELYRLKLSQTRYRAIVVSDNIALLLMSQLHEVVGNTPVIFGGINNYRAALHRDLNATGISEDIELKVNMSLIGNIQPQVKDIWVVSDHSITGNEIRSQVKRFLRENPLYQGRVHHWRPDSFDDVLARAEQLSRQDALLIWAYYRDHDGCLIGTDEWQQLTKITAAPVYSVHDIGIGQGAVGGVIQSGFRQGLQTAQMALKVLSDPSAPLPNVEGGQSEIKLDYVALQRWGLTSAKANGHVLNKPLSLIERLSAQLGTLISLFTATLFALAAMSFYVRRLRVSQQLARESQQKFESLFDQSLQLIGIADQHGYLHSVNSPLQTILGKFHYQTQPIWRYQHWHTDASHQLSNYFHGNTARICTFEAQIWSRQKGDMTLEVSLKPLANQTEIDPQYLFEARDITLRKMFENRLSQREASLRHYYDQQPVMMVTLDSHNRIQEVNRLTQELLGYSSLDMLGHRLREFYADPEAMVPRQVMLQPSDAVKGVWQREIEYRHIRGHKLWIRESIRALTDSGQLLIVGEDITQNKQLAQQLEYQARFDLLTDTYNRNQFELELEKALYEVVEGEHCHAMLFLDMDQLKLLNDTMGHAAGDATIQFCASMLEELLPYNAILARMGGDEFAILLRDCNEVGAVQVAKQIMTTLNAHMFVWETLRLHLTCSIGIRLIDHSVESAKMVYAQADTACVAAKEQGRNRYNLFSYDNEELNRRQLEMESVGLVYDALAHDHLILYAQRILPLSQPSDRIYLEILVRIQAPGDIALSPGVFVPASERYNIAHHIDRVVIDKTLDYFEAHPEIVAKLGRCAINLSGQSIGNNEFIAYLLARLQSTSVPCEKLCLEITETAAMSNVELALDFFSQVRQLGCLVALDDFGSGLSSFGYLKTMPVDIVKIDGLFVRDMAQNATDRGMVSAIHDLACLLGKQTVAEFVEDSETIEHLTALGIDYAQGYVVSKPMPLAELIATIFAEQNAESSQSVRYTAAKLA